MKREFKIDSLEGLPPLTVSFLDTLSIKTGTWRYLRPYFQQKTAPCHEACPAGSDVVNWVRLMNEGKPEEAYHLILQENPFPGICGRICFHPCERDCNRASFDQPIPIHLLERFLADFGHRHCSPLPAPSTRREEKVAIIGAGPSGLSCAYQLARMGYGVTVYEASPQPGGVLRSGIPEYRLPRSILDQEIGLIEALGVRIETGMKIGASLGINDLKEFSAVFIATGASRGLRLDIPGEDLQGVVSGLDFLESINLGQKQHNHGTVAVIGGGNTAMDAARSALRTGAEPLVLYRRSREEMPAFEDEVKEAEGEGVKMHFQVSPVKILGEEGRVRAVECIRTRLEEPDASGRRRPFPIEGSNFTLEVNHVITAIGETPELSFLEADVKIQDQMILTDSYTSTQREGFFAGGDVVPQPRSVVHAIGSGKMGAVAIDQYIRGEDVKDLEASMRIGGEGTFSMKRYLERLERSDRRARDRVLFESINLDYFERTDPVKNNRTPSEEAPKDFREVNSGLTEALALEKARGCFSCGLCNHCGNCLVFCPDIAVSLEEDKYPEVNYDYCKGCGICALECPRGAISLEEETG